MKCDKLKAYTLFTTSSLSGQRVYLTNDADAAIAELKQKLHDAEMKADLAECANTEYCIDIDKLKAQFKPLYEELKRVKDENAKLNDMLNVWNTYKILGDTNKKIQYTIRALCLLRAECARRKWCELYYEKKRDLCAFKNENHYITKQMEKYESIKQYWKAKAEEYM